FYGASGGKTVQGHVSFASESSRSGLKLQPCETSINLLLLPPRMINLRKSSLLCGCLFFSALGQVTYQNPVLPGDYPDPSVIRVGEDFYATATTSEWAPLFPLLHSRDLVNWTNIGAVFNKRPDWAVGNFWAPEISRFKDAYYIYYVGRKRNGPL